MGLSIIKPDTKIDFVGVRYWAFALSGLLILLGLISLIAKGGPSFGIDFAGGMIVQVKFGEEVDLGKLKDALDKTDLPGPVVQSFGQEGDHEYLIRLSNPDVPSDTVRQKLNETFEQNLNIKGFDVQRLEMVGPKVGADLRSKALEALFYATLLIAIYISGRFEHRWLTAGIMAAGLATGLYVLQLVGMPMGWLILAALIITLALCWYLKLNYALGAVVAIIHDVMITVGLFSILNKEFDLTIVAALLTIIGYSLNDTIIVFDRIRENINNKSAKNLGDIINLSVNQTLSRTILTSGTTLLVVLCLFLFGGGVIHDFALAMLVGIVAGTYSSIYVASPILMGFGASPSAPAPTDTEPAKA